MDSRDTSNVAIPFYVITFNRIRGLQAAYDYVNRSSMNLQLLLLDMGSSNIDFFDRVRDLEIPMIDMTDFRHPRELFRKGRITEIGSGPYFLSDGDIDYSDLPVDAFKKMVRVSEEFPWIPKVGLSLRTDHLPPTKETERIRKWLLPEQTIRLKKDCFLSGIDTTIAYYPRRSDSFSIRPAIRISGKYAVNHYPWEQIVTPESIYYESACNLDIASSVSGKFPGTVDVLKQFTILMFYFIVKYPMRTAVFGPSIVRIIQALHKRNFKS
jgi:hypothetical protein